MTTIKEIAEILTTAAFEREDENGVLKDESGLTKWNSEEWIDWLEMAREAGGFEWSTRSMREAAIILASEVRKDA